MLITSNVQGTLSRPALNIKRTTKSKQIFLNNSLSWSLNKSNLLIIWTEQFQSLLDDMVREFENKANIFTLWYGRSRLFYFLTRPNWLWIQREETFDILVTFDTCVRGASRWLLYCPACKNLPNEVATIHGNDPI